MKVWDFDWYFDLSMNLRVDIHFLMSMSLFLS
jgi:hypothetical protein